MAEGNYTKVPVNTHTESTEKPKTEVTEHGDINKTGYQQTLSPFINPDGTINEANIALYEQQRQNLANQYRVDNNGNYNGKISDLLGFDPAIREKELQEKEKLARFKQKEAGWKNALGVISDIVTSAAGGNVVQRADDKVASNAKQEVESANENIRTLGTAVTQAKRRQELAYAKAQAQLLNDFAKTHGLKMNYSNTKRGNDTKNITGGGRTSDSNSSVVVKNGNGNNSGSGRTGERKTIVVKTMNNGIESGNMTFNVPKSEAEAYVNQVKNELTRRFNDNDWRENNQAIYDRIVNSGVYDPNTGKWNDGQILSYGSTWLVGGLDDLFQQLWTKADEYNGKPLNLGVRVGEVTPSDGATNRMAGRKGARSAR